MLDKLNDRERLFLIAGGGTILITLLCIGVWKVLEHRGALREEVQVKRGQLQRIQEIGMFINRLPSGGQAPDADQLKNQLRQLVEQSRLSNSSQWQSRENLKDQGFTEIELTARFNSQQLVDIFQFLYDVEVRGAVPGRVTRLRLDHRSGSKVYDATISISVQRPTEGGQQRPGPAGGQQ
jgi:hypothetical protein